MKQKLRCASFTRGWFLGVAAIAAILNVVPPAISRAVCPEVEETCPALDLPDGFEPYDWALGFGKNTKGAETFNGYKSFETYYVTNTDDYLPGHPESGTLRYGIEEVATVQPTLILFAAGGDDIVLKYPLSLQNSEYVTLDGSNDSGIADGLGASITGDEFSVVDSHDVVIRYLRFR